jgi:hypothetical protein
LMVCARIFSLMHERSTHFALPQKGIDRDVDSSLELSRRV